MKMVMRRPCQSAKQRTVSCGLEQSRDSEGSGGADLQTQANNAPTIWPTLKMAKTIPVDACSFSDTP
jgi:hypothetical protein